MATISYHRDALAMRIPGDVAAKDLLTREHRAPFVVQEPVWFPTLHAVTQRPAMPRTN